MALNRTPAFIYLAVVPILFFVLAFTVAPVGPVVYLTVWLINLLLMIAAARQLQKNIPGDSLGKSIGWMLIVSVLLMPIFAGMGPPPSTREGWATAALEQQIRYILLIPAGVAVALGFSLLSKRLEGRESFYSSIGHTLILIKLPLFILNMSVWGGYLTAYYKLSVKDSSFVKPDWPYPLGELFLWIGSVETSLLYLSVAAFVTSLRKTGFLFAQ